MCALRRLFSGENLKNLNRYRYCGSGSAGSVCVLGFLDPDPDPLVRSANPASSLFQKGVERTEIMLATKIFAKNFSKKLKF
jgi:hypothetical protein